MNTSFVWLLSKRKQKKTTRIKPVLHLWMVACLIIVSRSQLRAVLFPSILGGLRNWSSSLLFARGSLANGNVKHTTERHTTIQNTEVAGYHQCQYKIKHTKEWTTNILNIKWYKIDAVCTGPSYDTMGKHHNFRPPKDTL